MGPLVLQQQWPLQGHPPICLPDMKSLGLETSRSQCMAPEISHSTGAEARNGSTVTIQPGFLYLGTPSGESLTFQDTSQTWSVTVALSHPSHKYLLMFETNLETNTKICGMVCTTEGLLSLSPYWSQQAQSLANRNWGKQWTSLCLLLLTT